MSVTNKVLICIILTFIAVLYFFSSFSVVKLIASYEELKNKELYLEFLKSENKKLVYLQEQIKKNNIEALKIHVLKSDSNEHYIVFDSSENIIPPFMLNKKTLYIYVYYSMGIIICALILMGILRTSIQYIEHPATGYYKGTKYNL